MYICVPVCVYRYTAHTRLTYIYRYTQVALIYSQIHTYTHTHIHTYTQVLLIMAIYAIMGVQLFRCVLSSVYVGGIVRYVCVGGRQ